MKINQIITENFNGEYDDEAGMAQTNLHTIARAAQGLLDTIDDQENLPEWVQEKIAKVEGMMVTAWDYLRSQEEQGIDPQMMEAKSAHPKQAATAIAMKKAGIKPKHMDESAELAEEFDLIESIIERLAQHNGVDAEVIWEDLETLTEDELYAFAVTSEPIMESQGVAEAVDIGKEWMSDTELDQYVPDRLQQQWRELLGYDMNGNPSAYWANLTGGYEPDVNDPQHRALMVKVANKWFTAKKIPNVKFFDVKDADDELEWLVQIGEQGVAESEAWQKANNRDKTDGMSRKAVNTYRREHPGSKLQTAVTTKPSKLKKGSKASKRRSSYCSRSRGQMKMHSISCSKTPDKAICKARRRWNC